MLKNSLIKLIGQLKEFSTLKVDSFDLLLTSDWSPILTRDSLCLPSGKRFDHQGTNSIPRIKYQSKITIYLLHRTKSHNKSISWRHFTALYPAGGGHCLGHCDCRPPLSLALFREGSKVLKMLCCSYISVFSVKVDQAIQLQAPQPCPSYGSAFIERAFHARDTSASSSSSVSKNTISTKSTFWGSSNSKLPYPLPQFPSSPTFVGPSVENPARTVCTPTRNPSQVIDQSKAHKWHTIDTLNLKIDMLTCRGQLAVDIKLTLPLMSR